MNRRNARLLAIGFVIPEEGRRGLFRSEFSGTTLRENLGLPVPDVGAWRSAVS
jgi:hypothetical protein